MLWARYRGMACSTGARDTGAPALFIVESFLSCSRTTTESRQRNVVSRTNGILGSLLFLLIVGIMVLDITVVGE